MSLLICTLGCQIELVVKGSIDLAGLPVLP
jgi:hypothetical protein